MSKEKLGNGWDRQGDEGKKYVSVALDLGMLGNLSCALFENARRDASRNQPTHNLVWTPEGGKTKYVGAFWKKQGKKGQEYLMGRLALKELGTIRLGGTFVDFSKQEAPISAKICRAAKVDGKSPQYHVFRVAPAAKTPAAGEEE